MSKSTAWQQALLKLALNNTNAANIGDATGLRGSSTAGSVYVSLHNADPGVGGNQATNETAYTSYARVAVARSGAGWVIGAAGGGVSPVGPQADINWPQCTAGSGIVDTITHFGIGTDPSGAGEMLWSGIVAPSIIVANGTVPQLPAASNSALVTEA